MNCNLGLLLCVAAFACAQQMSLAHIGHRFEVVVADEQLALHGYNTGPDDGAPSPRPYYNALHSAWNNVGGSVSIADLPGFDVFAPEASYVGNGAAEHLAGSTLSLTLTGAYEWTNVPLVEPFGVPNLQPLAPQKEISVGNATQSVDTVHFGTLTLVDSVSPTGNTDIDLDYVAQFQAIDSLVVLAWQATTTVPGIATSHPVYTIFSPDPTAGPNYSDQALALERFLSTPIHPGDYTRDGAVDHADYVAWKNQFGAEWLHPGAGADGNGDGAVNLADYTVWRDSVGAGVSPLTAAIIPEPSTIVALCLTACALPAIRSAALRPRFQNVF